MKQEKYSNINTEAFDFKYIYRSLKKYLIYIQIILNREYILMKIK